MSERLHYFDDPLGGPLVTFEGESDLDDAAGPDLRRPKSCAERTSEHARQLSLWAEEARRRRAPVGRGRRLSNGSSGGGPPDFKMRGRSRSSCDRDRLPSNLSVRTPSNLSSRMSRSPSNKSLVIRITPSNSTMSLFSDIDSSLDGLSQSSRQDKDRSRLSTPVASARKSSKEPPKPKDNSRPISVQALTKTSPSREPEKTKRSAGDGTALPRRKSWTRKLFRSLRMSKRDRTGLDSP